MHSRCPPPPTPYLSVHMKHSKVYFANLSARGDSKKETRHNHENTVTLILFHTFTISVRFIHNSLLIPLFEFNFSE